MEGSSTAEQQSSNPIRRAVGTAAHVPPLQHIPLTITPKGACGPAATCAVIDGERDCVIACTIDRYIYPTSPPSIGQDAFLYSLHLNPTGWHMLPDSLSHHDDRPLTSSSFRHCPTSLHDSSIPGKGTMDLGLPLLLYGYTSIELPGTLCGTAPTLASTAEICTLVPSFTARSTAASNLRTL